MDHAVAVESLNAGERIGAQRYVQTGGGMAATGMVAAVRLGARCSLASSAGDDPAGHFIREELAAEGIDLAYFRLRPTGRTGVSLCMSETCTGRKLIIGLAGGTQRMTPSDVDDGFYRMVRGAKMLHLDGFHGELAIAAAEHARDAGVPVHLDATMGGPGSDRFLAISDIVFASQSFCERRFSRDVSPKALDWLLDITPARWVGLTMGAAGSIALDRKTNKRHFQPAFDIQVLDTVGAGDSFHGAMSFALARGWPMDKAMRLATAVGAMCCLGLGGREGLPTLRQAQAFLRKAKPLAPKKLTRYR
jgi:sulfofructose kinase